jgi:hypothetical protein
VSTSGRERVNREGKAGGIKSMYFIYLDINRTMKLVEIILIGG